jgi:hypothetical protein
MSANTGKPHLLPTFEEITEEIEGVKETQQDKVHFMKCMK